MYEQEDQKWVDLGLFIRLSLVTDHVLLNNRVRIEVGRADPMRTELPVDKFKQAIEELLDCKIVGKE